MATVVQCTNCGKKLKMVKPTPGKKLRCPACKEPFVLKGGPARKKKKRPAPPPVDDFDDFGDEFGDDDGYSEAPAPRKKKKSSKKKAAASSGKSKAPLFIGVGVLGVALAGTLVYFLMPGGDDGSTEVASTDETSTDDGSGEAALGGSADSADEHGGSTEAGYDEAMMAAAEPGAAANDEHGGSSSSSAMSANSEHGGPAETSSAGAAGAAAAPAPRTAAGSDLSLAYLPAGSEGAVFLDVARLMDGPLGALFQQPQIAQQVEGFRAATGLGPESFQSVTVGIGDISSLISSGTVMSPASLPFTVVVRTTSSVDLGRLQPMIPGAETATGPMPMLKIPAPKPGEPAALVWQADNNTLVFGAEPSVNAAMKSPSASTNIDTKLLSQNQPIQLIFSPANPDAVFRHPKAKIPEGAPTPPAAMQFAKTFLAKANAAAIGIDLTGDLGFDMAIRCSDEAEAQQLAADIKAWQEDSKATQAQQPPDMMLMLVMNIQKQMEESQVIEAQGNICRASAAAKGGGTQIANLIPMAAGMMMAGMQNGMQGMGPGAFSPGGGFGGPPQDGLRNAALAMHNFHDIYGRFPNAASKSDDGTLLLSWRVHILPFLGYQDLYEQFKLDEPWNSEHNMALADQMPEIYGSPDVSAPARTVLLAPTGTAAAFENAAGRSMREFTDGTSNTILILQAPPESAVIWTQPVDYSGDGSDLPENIRVAMADGSPRDVTATSIQPMLTRNGGEIVE